MLEIFDMSVYSGVQVNRHVALLSNNFLYSCTTTVVLYENFKKLHSLQKIAVQLKRHVAVLGSYSIRIFKHEILSLNLTKAVEIYLCNGKPGGGLIRK